LAVDYVYWERLQIGIMVIYARKHVRRQPARLHPPLVHLDRVTLVFCTDGVDRFDALDGFQVHPGLQFGTVPTSPSRPEDRHSDIV
jgi:hypothetical protein